MDDKQILELKHNILDFMGSNGNLYHLELSVLYDRIVERINFEISRQLFELYITDLEHERMVNFYKDKREKSVKVTTLGIKTSEGEGYKGYYNKTVLEYQEQQKELEDEKRIKEMQNQKLDLEIKHLKLSRWLGISGFVISVILLIIKILEWILPE